MKVLLENLLRAEDGRSVTKADIEAVAAWIKDKGKAGKEIAFRPARVLMQDFTGVPAVVDLAAMRDAMKALGGDPQKINPLVPVDLVIDHSVIVDEFGSPKAFKKNVDLEYARNGERYRFLKWGQQAFKNFSVVPPGTGICHQVNLEYLAQTVWTKKEKVKKTVRGKTVTETVEIAYPDTLVGTDSHTTMVNGLAVLGWGVGGIEAEAAMLGQPQSMLLPEVIGFKLTGKLKEGVTATDLVLTVTQMLRKKGVVGKFVEFYGPGLNNMTLADRATIANMAPEYGATCGFFPVDDETLNYLTTSGRKSARIALVEKYSKAQGPLPHQGLARPGLHRHPVARPRRGRPLDGRPEASRGPRRPRGGGRRLRRCHGEGLQEGRRDEPPRQGRGQGLHPRPWRRGHRRHHLLHQHLEPGGALRRGSLARNAIAKGLKTKPWVKTSLAPGSQVVAEYLANSGLQKDLDKLGFNLVGFGCTTCIGNSGPLPAEISKAINDSGLIASAVLSGNRNFEGRVSPDVQANYLASPPLVVAYALAGSVTMDLTKEPIGTDKKGNPVYLRDIWPSSQEINAFIAKNVTKKLFKERYADVFKGDANWAKVKAPTGQTYAWDDKSTYVQNPPYFVGMGMKPGAISNIEGARVLGLFGDKITTDHISPAGSIKAASPAGKYLIDNKVDVADFNQYGTRRGNHEVMMRGTFANIRIRNHMMGPNGKEGGYTIHYPSKEEMSIYDAAMKYRAEKVPLVVFAGVEYGNGSSRDWAAKGTNLLGVRAVIAQSFERIHRSNLVGMGIVPFTFEEGTTWASLGLKGDETVTIKGLEKVKPRQKMEAEVTFADGKVKKVPILCRIDTLDEIEYFKNGGILQYVLRDLAA